MSTAKEGLLEIFQELDRKISTMNQERDRDGAPQLSRAKIRLLGQMSLLVVEKLSVTLSLAQTGDLDALLTMEYVVKEELKRLLKKHGLVYDEDSYLIWVPPQSQFNLFYDSKNVLVESIDPESALVSKALKAPDKNKQLIQDAIASDAFPGLVDRILENGGDLEFFS
jgi:hypothetical protein